MKRLLALALAAAALAALPGCLLTRDTTNEALPRDAVTSLTPGQTTAADVLTRFGAPNQVVQLGFRSAYYYEFGTSKRAGLFLFVVNLANTDTRTDRLWMFFDEEDVLTHVGATYDAGDAKYVLPWSKPD